MQIEYFDHPHPLSFNEAIEQNRNLLCNAYSLEISTQACACKNCKYCLHKTCTTLPYEVPHLSHPSILSSSSRMDVSHSHVMNAETILMGLFTSAIHVISILT
ncbi:Uncharacterized protein TCM_026159 [Theobroma cacao]|uniref:Uncharacterized protein n=1 Tax=Theobroma cacao TaxID=3641 RepID=A0A061F1S8_THECC|nr:Uncharacterized protein TCM_026159 [Theobroma cacao]